MGNKLSMYLLIVLNCFFKQGFCASIPIANFTASNTSVCQGQCVSFTDLSANFPTSWAWSFQGATLLASSQQNPSNICYNTAGTYFVSLTVSNASGSNTLYLAGYITVYPTSAVNLLPNGDFNNYNTAFNTQLTYIPSGALAPDQFSIDTNAWYHNGNWAAISPDTTPFFMCDGSLTAGQLVWSENISTIFRSSAYTFSFLMTNLDVNHTFVDPELMTTITDQAGTVLFNGTTGLLPAANSNNPPTYVWTQFGYVFNTLSNTTAITISINQVGGTYLGFDFALENVFLKTHFCDSVAAMPDAGLFTDENHICPGVCADFINISTNSTSCLWLFPGGSPSTSTDMNPQQVCYNTPGDYDVTLIAMNGNGADTLTITGYVSVWPYPAPQGIQQNGDTLFANPGAVFYRWYHNGALISGATNYFCLADSSGNYNVVATDSNGCEVEAVIFDVVASVASAYADVPITIYPNPASDKIEISGLNGNHDSVINGFSIYNLLGAEVSSLLSGDLPHQLPLSVDVSTLPKGIYFIEITSSANVYRTKFNKE